MLRLCLQILLVLFALFVSQCAQVGSLTGGAKDTTPPVPLVFTPQNLNTNFNSEKVIIRFDEFIQLKSLATELVVSPALSNPPDIQAVGKDLVIDLKDEKLEPNTTYRFYFGKAVADMHESNSIQDFEYIFSTGDHIDTFQIKGSVLDARSKQTVSGCLIMFYKNGNADSLLYKSKPDYLARTSPDGQYRIPYLPPGKFELFAIKDNNNNGLYDGPPEKVAFKNEPLVIDRDSIVDLNLFEEKPTKIFIKNVSSPFFGKSLIVLNTESEVSLSLMNKSDTALFYETDQNLVKDTIEIFYHNVSDSLHLILHNKTFKRTDTVHLVVPPKTRSARRLKAIVTNITGNKLPSAKKLQLNFPVWMDTSSSNLRSMRITTSDSLTPPPKLSGNWIDINTFEISTVYKTGVTYSIAIDTGAFHDVTGVSNDSLRFSFTPESESDLGTLKLNVLFYKKGAHVVEILNEQGNVVASERVVLSLSSENKVSLIFTGLIPAVYLARIIDDDNKNGKWDTGLLSNKQQPEEIYISSKQLKVIADWEIEEEIATIERTASGEKEKSKNK